MGVPKMTFSIAAICPDTGEIGYAVATSSVCVGARVGAAIAGQCVVFSQARTDPRLHQHGLDAYVETGDVDDALEAMRDQASQTHWRQLGVLGRDGTGRHFTGSSCQAEADGVVGSNCLALGNAIANKAVLPAMIAGAETSTGRLAERLIAALKAGQDAGGEHDPLQSAALQVYGSHEFPLADLRIDKSDDPILELLDLWRDWSPKAAAYTVRAIDPDAAPSSDEVEGFE
jgi:uncharacterized Ntn-hydrolase superfamily protein